MGIFRGRKESNANEQKLPIVKKCYFVESLDKMQHDLPNNTKKYEKWVRKTAC